jgi:O-antigen ligase
MVSRLVPQRLQSFILDHSALLLRALMVVGVVLVSAAAAAIGEGLPLLVMGAVVGLFGAAALLKWPEAGFPLLIFAGMLVPFSLGTGTQTGINAALLVVAGLTGLWVLDMVAREQRLALLRSRTIPPILAFIVVACLSLGFGQLRWLPLSGASMAAQVGGLSLFVLSACAFLVTAHRISSVRGLEWMTWTLLILGAVYIVAVIIAGQPRLMRMANRTFQRAVQDSMFWTWMMSLAVSQALFNRRLRLPVRAALAVLGLTTLYITVVVKQSWTSGWLPGLVAAYVIVLLWKPRLGIALGVFGAFALVVSNVLLAGDNAYSIETRLEAWRIMFELIKRSPILGLGPANYYFYTPYYSILGYYVQFNSHNNYVDLLAQLGVAGLACFAWFAWAMGRVAWDLRSRVPEGFPQAYVYGVLGGLAGALVAGMLGDWILPFVYNVGLAGFRASMLTWLFFGGVVVLEKLYGGQAVADGRL